MILYQLVAVLCHTCQNLAPAQKIEVVVSDLLVEKIIEDLLEILGTGSGAIGKIFVSNVAKAYDIGSSEKDDAVL